MKRNQTRSGRPRRHARGHRVLERLAELIKPNPQDDPEWLRLEDEKLRQARFALFGSAPE